MADKKYGWRVQNILPTGKWWDLHLTKLLHLKRLGNWPNTHAPSTLNEFTLSQKENFRGDLELASILTDKVLIKNWLAENGFSDLVIPTFGIFRNLEDLKNYLIPGNAVAKSTHGSGDVMLLDGRAGTMFSESEQKAFSAWLKEDFYLRCREINYKGLQRGIIVEEMLSGSNGSVPEDYKIYYVNGKVFMYQVDLSRFSGHVQQLFDHKWNYIRSSRVYNPSVKPVAQPALLETMAKRLAKIAERFFLCRIDIYLVNESKPYIGEVTFFPHNGVGEFSPKCGDRLIGSLINARLQV